jgi:hypothetical protein
MFKRLKQYAISLVRMVRAAIIAALALHAGCDRPAAWRGVGTDAGDRDQQPSPDVPRGNSNDVPRA